jgi:carbon monoxide dehydrogenase subunit G
MRLENRFEVSGSPDTAWAILTDVPRIVPCMPGAQLEETVGENDWKVAMNVKLGPIALRFSTDLHRQELDENARRVVLSAKAREARGRGGAQATIESTLHPAAAGSRVEIVTDLSLQGAVAQYGRGVVPDVAAELTSRFADCVQRQLAAAGERSVAPTAEPPPAARPVGGLGLALVAFWRRVKRLLHLG